MNLSTATLGETLLSALLQVPEASRGTALQAVLVTYPPSAVSVIKRFYEPNYALTTRAAMLDALIDAAHELARLPKSNAVPREAPQGAADNSCFLQFFFFCLYRPKRSPTYRGPHPALSKKETL